jgi:hypothetical protein
MANKSFSKLTTRNQGNLVSQIHKLIKNYVDFFVMRDRIYIKNLSKIDGSIYWIADTSNELVAMALLEPDHHFELDGVMYKTLGHVISRKIGVIDRIISHIWEDHKDHSLVAFSKQNLSHALTATNPDIVEFTAIELLESWPAMASRNTDYFNVRNETTLQAMIRKSQNLYVKFGVKDIEIIKNNDPKLFECISNKQTKK